MNKILGIILITLVYAQFALSEVYPVGVSSYRQGVYQTTASQLWTGGGENQLVDFGESGETIENSYSLSMVRGLGNKWQFETQLFYKNRKMKSGTEGGIKKGKERGHLSNIQIGVVKSIITGKNKSSEVAIHFSHPGNSGNSQSPNKSPDSFLALNKGAQKLLLQSRNHLQLNSKLSFDYGLEYAYRFGDPADQITLDFISNYAISNKVFIGIGVKYLNTLGGIDVSSSEFSDESNSRRGGDAGSSEINAFSIVREISLSSALTVGYRLRSDIFLDGYYSEVLDGENRDKAKTIGMGVTFYSF